jgi:4-amino-4-deoxy-L-arabinose transferase-like glycosyltransferase
MNYFTAAIYMVVGRNLFAAQSVCGLIGAAVAPMVFFCARNVYSNMRVAKFAAVCVAVFPALVIWSSLLLKDPLLMFLLVATMTLVLQLQKKLSYITIAVLAGCLFAIFSLRFYVFYMIAVAVVGSILIGFTTSTASIIRGIVILAVVGVGLTYFGVLQDASANLETFGSLERLQDSRRDLAQRATSGFGQDLDVSTTEGALSALPLGVYVMMLAPFPWAAVNLRQAITIPDVLLWWSLLPFLLLGLIYTVRHRLRNAFPILVFTLLLTLAYALFQGNVGTAYRHRTQLQVFFFILIGVGWTVFKEYRENKGIERAASQRRMERHLMQNKTLAKGS